MVEPAKVSNDETPMETAETLPPTQSMDRSLPSTPGDATPADASNVIEATPTDNPQQSEPSENVPLETSDKQPTHSDPSIGSSAEVQERFTQQLARLEEHHQAELSSLQAAHTRELAETKEMAEQLRIELQQRTEAQILAKEEQLQEVCRRNEGYRLKLDMLKREVTGTQELLQEKDSAAGKASQKFLNDLRAMEKQAVEAESKADQAANERQKIQSELDATKQELKDAHKEHEELKQRVKVVATELKERRVECRELNAKIDEIMDEKGKLQENIDSLSERLNHQGVSQTEKDGEMEKLKAQLVDSQLSLEKATMDWKEKETKHEQAMTEYKRKAQNSLAMANSRIAAAVQAREEAELDARAARTTADSAFERATKAEITSREAVAEARARMGAVEAEKKVIDKQLEQTKQKLDETVSDFATLEEKLKQAADGRDTKARELEEVRSELRSMQVKSAEFEQRFSEAEKSNKRLHEEKEAIGDQLQAALAELNQLHAKSDDNGTDHFIPAGQITELLQNELTEANEAIEGLKEALKKALQEKDSIGSEENGAHGNGQQADGSMQLFYAMEKQAELKTARAEINRLASSLSDVQSEKAEAIEAMQTMRRRMEEAESKLKRVEKLAPANTASQGEDGASTEANSGAVNVEYLKHIMLKFVSAKTTPERRALVPVIGAILELTADETATAMEELSKVAARQVAFLDFDRLTRSTLPLSRGAVICDMSDC